MEINPLNSAILANPAAAAGLQTLLRITGGDVSQIQTGITVAVSVLRAGQGEAVVNLGGKPVTVKSNLTLTAGDVLNVRVNGGANPSLEVLGRQTPPTAKPTVPPPADQPPSSEIAVVEVVGQEAKGQVRVRIDGEEEVAASKQPLQSGGKYVLQVDRSGGRTVLTPPPPDSPALPTTVATALLRTERPPPLADAIRPLLKELDAVPEQPQAKAAAAEVRTAVRNIAPEGDHPPTVERLRALVEDGGQQFEAKLARATESPPPQDAPAESKPVAKADKPDDPKTTTTTKAASDIGDLKGGLLKLVRALPDAATTLPATNSVLNGIERQQAVNVLAQQNGGPYVFQVPFQDGSQWRTLSLGLEPDREGTRDETGRPTGFRVMMHVPLSGLGETWIDAGADGTRLRAALYLSDDAARDRVRPELAGLKQELQAAGFSDVLLELKPASDLTDRQRRRVNAIRAGVPEQGGVLDVRA